MTDTKRNYRETLFLPETDFPLRAGLSKKEPQWLEHWKNIGLYERLREQSKAEGRTPWTLHDGPPYANGHIHMGHAVNKILKDVVVKSQTMLGKDAPYVPGWDCHGLPIELNVEKKVGKPGVKISAAEFREKCRAYASREIDGQREDFMRMGVLGDWDNPYLTLDKAYEADIIRALAKITKNGHLDWKASLSSTL